MKISLEQAVKIIGKRKLQCTHDFFPDGMIAMARVVHHDDKITIQVFAHVETESLGGIVFDNGDKFFTRQNGKIVCKSKDDGEAIIYPDEYIPQENLQR